MTDPDCLYAVDLDEQLAAAQASGSPDCPPPWSHVWIRPPCHRAAPLLVGYAADTETLLLACGVCQHEVVKIAVQPRPPG